MAFSERDADNVMGRRDCGDVNENEDDGNAGGNGSEASEELADSERV